MMAAAAMALSSLSVVTNAYRLRSFTAEPPATAPPVPDDLQVSIETGPEATRKVTDPVCGMQVNPTTAISADVNGTTQYFCSTGCRDTYLTTPRAART